RASATKPRMAFKKTMAMLDTASRYQPRSPELSVANSRTSTMTALNWFRNTIKGEVFSPSLSREGPTVFSRLAASLGSKPTAGSTSKWAATRSASQSTQRLFSDTSTPPLPHSDPPVVSGGRMRFRNALLGSQFQYNMPSYDKSVSEGHRIYSSV